MTTVLVVEDSRTDLQIIILCLQQRGLDILTAESGEESLTKISQQKPDIIILDIILPGCSGFQICRELKETAATSKILIILCSTKNGQIDRFWGMKQGADAYLPKP